MKLRGFAGMLLLLGAMLVTPGIAGQFQMPGRWWNPPRTAGPDSFDGGFQFCRVMFDRNPVGDGGRWSVDYPRADINMSVRLSELTATRVSFDAAGEPKHVLVRLTDPELFRCPFVMMTEVGAAFVDDREAAALREYLVKGGFLWADDFWGTYAWEIWVRELRKALPAGEYPIVDLPDDHPLFRAHFQVSDVPQIPSINFWSWTGGATSERGADSAVARARAIVGRNNRLLVLMTHNTDIGDSWEREADDPEYFYRFSVDGYAFGINVLIYAMSH